MRRARALNGIAISRHSSTKNGRIAATRKAVTSNL
jgi:hypothetical protein